MDLSTERNLKALEALEAKRELDIVEHTIFYRIKFPSNEAYHESINDYIERYKYTDKIPLMITPNSDSSEIHVVAVRYITPTNATHSARFGKYK